MLTTRSITLDTESEQSALHAACEQGNIQDVKAALQDGERVVNAFQDGKTPLHLAVMKGGPQAFDIISLLLDHGADLNAQTRGDEDTALHLVVTNGDFPSDFSVVLMFLENNVDLSVRNRKLRTPYDCAMGKGYFELASTLDGSMPPEQARRFYMEKIGEKYGPYITAAVLRSDRHLLEENIRLGGNPNMLNKHGAGAIHYAITHCNLPVMEVLQALLDADADVNLRDDEGDNGLNLAIKSSKLYQSGDLIPVVTLLVNHGADATLKDLDGRDAFMLAEERGYQDVLEILRAPRKAPPPPRRAEVEPEVVPADPPKKEEVEPEFEPDVEPEVLTEVIPDDPPEDVQPEFKKQQSEEKKEEFPDPNAKNSEGLYPIHIASARDNAQERHDLVESLTERGARISEVTAEEGNTALHICALKNHGDTAKQLLDHHIDHTVKNNDGKTALDISKEHGHDPVTSAIEAKEKEIQDKWKRGGKKAGTCVIL